MPKQISLIFLLIITSLFDFSAMGQNATGSLSRLLLKYYEIKDALVKGDAGAAGKIAGEFYLNANSIDLKNLTPTEREAFKPLQAKLAANAKSISESKDIGKQREAFASLSQNMITLAKEVKLSDQIIYVDFCPMRKNYWLSVDKPIKNPYYGNAMLSCGNVSDTINK